MGSPNWCDRCADYRPASHRHEPLPPRPGRIDIMEAKIADLEARLAAIEARP